MALLAIEHGRVAYWADFAAYGAGAGALAAALALLAPRGQGASLAALAVAGAVAWTLVEYAVHRFVLHGLQPFRSWHTRHHDRPQALIAAPTLLSAALITALVFVPALLAVGGWRAMALSLGLTTGYLAYGLTHHATHHWRARGAWLKRRKRWHALHHHVDGSGGYGVCSSFWDHVFGTVPGRRRPR
jgi:cyclopropane-fatty-acyl-phospholipid synthase